MWNAFLTPWWKCQKRIMRAISHAREPERNGSWMGARQETGSCKYEWLTNAYYRYIPGHIHAFYLEFVYYERKEQAREGRFTASRAPGIYSERVQSGGQGYGTIVQPVH
jgi:hypothetical protein